MLKQPVSRNILHSKLSVKLGYSDKVKLRDSFIKACMLNCVPNLVK